MEPGRHILRELVRARPANGAKSKVRGHETQRLIIYDFNAARQRTLRVEYRPAARRARRESQNGGHEKEAPDLAIKAPERAVD